MKPVHGSVARQCSILCSEPDHIEVWCGKCQRWLPVLSWNTPEYMLARHDRYSHELADAG